MRGQASTLAGLNLPRGRNTIGLTATAPVGVLKRMAELLRATCPEIELVLLIQKGREAALSAQFPEIRRLAVLPEGIYSQASRGLIDLEALRALAPALIMVAYNNAEGKGYERLHADLLRGCPHARHLAVYAREAAGQASPLYLAPMTIELLHRRYRQDPVLIPVSRVLLLPLLSALVAAWTIGGCLLHGCWPARVSSRPRRQA